LNAKVKAKLQTYTKEQLEKMLKTVKNTNTKKLIEEVLATK